MAVRYYLPLMDVSKRLRFASGKYSLNTGFHLVVHVLQMPEPQEMGSAKHEQLQILYVMREVQKGGSTVDDSKGFNNIPLGLEVFQEIGDNANERIRGVFLR